MEPGTGAGGSGGIAAESGNRAAGPGDEHNDGGGRGADEQRADDSGRDTEELERGCRQDRDQDRPDHTVVGAGRYASPQVDARDAAYQE